MLLLVAATAVVAMTALGQARLLGVVGADGLLAAAVLSVADVVLLSFGLALFGRYARGPLVVGTLALAAVTAVAVRVRRPPPIALRLSARWQPRGPAEWLAVVLLLLAALQLLDRLLVALRLAPYGFDALWYHLTAVGWLVQDGRLPGPETGLVSGYPLGGELLPAWTAVLLRADSLVGVPQIAMTVVGGAATTGLARAVGVPRPHAVAAGAVFMLTPALVAQASTAYVDVTAAALTLAATRFVARWATRTAGTAAWGRLVVAGAAAGLAAGTKLTSAPAALVLLVIVVVVARTGGARHAARAGTLFALVCAAAGGGWYVRNGVVHGNPVYPVSVAGLPGLGEVSDFRTLAPGPRREPMRTAWSWAHDLTLRADIVYDEQRGGLGTVFLLVGLPCLVAAAAHAIRRRDGRWLLVLLPAAACLAQPYPWWARFTFPLAAAGAVAIAAALARLAGRRTAERALVAAVLVTVAVVQAPLARAVRYGDGRPPVPLGVVLGMSPGAPGAVGARATSAVALDPVEGARTVAVAVGEVRRLSPLFGERYQRRVVAVDESSQAAFAASVAGADVLLACRASVVGRWAALDPRHLRQVGDAESDIGVWRVTGTPAVVPDAPPADGTRRRCDGAGHRVRR